MSPNLVTGEVGGKPVLEDITVVDAGPDRFEATARLQPGLGNGVGPVFVNRGAKWG